MLFPFLPLNILKILKKTKQKLQHKKRSNVISDFLFSFFRFNFSSQNLLYVQKVVYKYYNQYIEQRMEKDKFLNIKRKSKYQESQQQQSFSNLSKLKKKIKKNHRRKKGQLSRGSTEANHQLSAFQEKNTVYFSTSIKESMRNFRNRLESKVHIREILNTQNIQCFERIKGNTQKQLEVYFDLLNSMRRCMIIEKIELVALEYNLKMKLRYLKQVLAVDQEGFEICTVKRIINENEFILLKLRQQALTQIERFFNSYTDSKRQNRVEIPQNLLQLMSLCKLNAATERQIIKRIDQIAYRQDPLYNLHLARDTQQEQFLQNQLIGAMIVKNLEKSFSQAAIDFFNYHKANQYYQENNHFETAFDKITYLSQFRKYALAKKPKSHKSDCYLLRTACSACLTQFSQLSNPIENCPQCHARIHRHCQKIDNRCHRCRYGRTSNQQKLQTGYCYICNRQREKGLMIITVNNRAPHQYAHEYCLLLHQFWTVQNQQFTGEYRQPHLQNLKCSFCQNSQGHFFNCSCCGNSIHGMCAYLHGASFKMERRENDYVVDIKCCNDRGLKQRLSIERKFKINFEKIIFREDKELYQYIEQKWERL